MKTILFVCAANVGRSQFGEAYFNQTAPEGYRAASAGTHAKEGRYLPPNIIERFVEAGFDVSGRTRTLLSEDSVRDSHKTIVLLEDHERKLLPEWIGSYDGKVVYRGVPDAPRGSSPEIFYRMRDTTRDVVKSLVDELGEER